MKYMNYCLLTLLTVLAPLASWSMPQGTTVPSGIYGLTEDEVITPQSTVLEGELTPNDSATPYFFPKGVTFAAHISGNVATLSLILDEADDPDFPEQIHLSLEGFRRLKAEFISEGTQEELMAALTDGEATIQNARYGSNTSRRTRSRGRMHYKGARGCVAYVLSKIGWPGGRSGNGVMITRTLKAKMGYKPVSCTNPQPGTIASWSGGSGAGHTAIWNGRCWAYDIACADPGRRFRLIECVAR
ncbi:MAG: hypothetical protein K2Q26_06155 [Bdellovibrionales bacterium]|nr:hypothetical protein [Bdellovibrionales bacterium]